MKVYTKECVSCNEPWVYIRLTRREAALVVNQPAGQTWNRLAEKIWHELKGTEERKGKK